jgi:hypothetical protein
VSRAENGIPYYVLPTPRGQEPWRYRWPHDFCDEALSRLLELNRQRAEGERLSGLAAAEGKPEARAPKRTGSAVRHPYSS